MNISMSKPRYACTLLHWDSRDIHNLRAIIIRLDNHSVLGSPNGKATLTSRVLRIDTQEKLIETLNSVYCYGG